MRNLSQHVKILTLTSVTHCAITKLQHPHQVVLMLILSFNSRNLMFGINHQYLNIWYNLLWQPKVEIGITQLLCKCKSCVKIPKKPMINIYFITHLAALYIWILMDFSLINPPPSPYKFNLIKRISSALILEAIRLTCSS